MRERTEHYDTVVIGGGAAGLGGALALARARRSVLVIDGGEPRNAPAAHVHTYLGREGTPPAELLALGRAEVESYGATVVTGNVTAVRRLPAREGDGFLLACEDGTEVVARRLLVATGLVDEKPDVPGLAERFGQDVLHCPYCHGWEVRDTPVGVLATGPLAVHQALLWRQWSDDVTLFTHTAADFGDEAYEQLAACGITVVDGEVTGLEVTDGRLTGVRLGDRVVPRATLAVAPRFTARSALLTGLGLKSAEQVVAGHVVGTYVPSDATGATDVPGVWVAGNVTSLAEQVIGAAAAGVRAGAAINADLVAVRTSQAVAARRAAGTHPGPHAPGGGEALDMREFWDERYAGSGRVWSGEPNAELVREAGDLPPGRALDLACGEGGDAVWLAGRGWHVTAADISRVALGRAAEHAARAGVGDLIDWQWHDLADTFPEGEYDLVSAQFLHSTGGLPREDILRSAAAAVAPGGVLLVTGHSGGAPWEEHGHPGVVLPTPAEVLAELRLADGAWSVERCEDHERLQTAPDGTRMARTDNTVRVRRVTK
ncbi:bifunctional NAD(P)/FAD-dependent oxidoreductase/class I SAM-dependent methyltransferase [Streptomyces sp. NBC_01497]|uniref:bifunctional NAD(P)/FAD-dependent oxidoreductase/class I SAM-dependent methyltransferase n=1 Tax=Streptomyces sp. NBC_01497 TaxID=2903885 RepID=UPI002E3437DC|nr:bifunctional NAD(P)/FAD-dependent oxidoreductase/class I SAM-dependent methyltransferase [Streptomyces sp. NBC_01497]